MTLNKSFTCKTKKKIQSQFFAIRSCLNNFISDRLRSSKKENIAALHWFVFECEGG